MLTIFHNKKIRLHVLCGLVFSIFISCSGHKEQISQVTIDWHGNRAIGIGFPPDLYRGISYDSIDQLIQVRLSNASAPILGEFSFVENILMFRPLIPFTHGLKYDLYIRGKAVQSFEIPVVSLTTPQVASIYPSADTLPQNLLKFYIEFSQPMQQGDVMKNISIIKNDRDTVPVFLDLELWNNERTMLTLWLDPGRVKRDLQPNLKMGPPLIEGAQYRLLIKNGLRDTEGMSMHEAYHKDFIAGKRDTLSPDPNFWTIEPPKAGSNLPLRINLHESLDHTLLKNALLIIDKSDGHTMDGTFETGSGERVLNFTPHVNWNSGDYIIGIETRLEDLAGNNLDRLFDRDITKQEKKVAKKVNQIQFHIQ